MMPPAIGHSYSLSADYTESALTRQATNIHCSKLPLPNQHVQGQANDNKTTIGAPKQG